MKIRGATELLRLAVRVYGEDAIVHRIVLTHSRICVSTDKGTTEV